MISMFYITYLDITMENVISMQVLKSQQDLNKPFAEFLITNRKEEIQKLCQ